MTQTTPLSMRARLDAGETLVGTMNDLLDPLLLELLGYIGYDYVLLEHEHGLRSLESIQHLIRAAEAAGLYTLIRIGTPDASLIQRLLEGGVTGVMVAHIKTRDEAEAIVRAAHYPPRGTRGEGYSRTGKLWKIGPETTQLHEDADRDVMVFAIIEDPEGVDNIDEIVSVPGLTGIAPGYADLAAGLGGIPLDSPEVADRGKLIQQAVDSVPGLLMLSMVQDAKNVPVLVKEGNQLILWNHDIILIGEMYKRLLAETKSALADTAT